jgi:hypothetical protein
MEEWNCGRVEWREGLLKLSSTGGPAEYPNFYL